MSTFEVPGGNDGGLWLLGGGEAIPVAPYNPDHHGTDYFWVDSGSVPACFPVGVSPYLSKHDLQVIAEYGRPLPLGQAFLPDNNHGQQ